MEHIYANLSASITEFKKNPTALLNRAEGEPIAILNHNKPAAYLIPVSVYEQLLDALENSELLEIARQRLDEKKNARKIKLNDL